MTYLADVFPVNPASGGYFISGPLAFHHTRSRVILVVMKILYIGGTGQISFDCIHESVRAGHDVHVFNRGNHNDGLPPEVQPIIGDMNDDAAYASLATHRFDVVCQFRVFNVEQLKRDLKIFTGHCGRYVFISSASAYEKPMRHHVVTEDVPRVNPFWQYSQDKADCEAVLMAQQELEYVIVRPSHTSRTKFTTAFHNGDHWAQRILAGQPIIVPGDGTQLWTITRSEDFAPPFVRLITAEAAANDHFHLTSDHAYMWNEIYAAIGRALGVDQVQLAHVPTDTLIRYQPEWIGPLKGDKAYSVVFDNRKIKSVVGEFACPTTLDQFCQRCVAHFDPSRLPAPSESDEALINRIIADQQALGA